MGFSALQSSGIAIAALLESGLVVAGTGHRPDKVADMRRQSWSREWLWDGIGRLPKLHSPKAYRCSRQRYGRILAAAAAVHIVSPGGFSNRAMQARNEWMVDHCSRVLALWDGSKGETFNCIDYARRMERPIYNLWPSWLKHRDAA